MEFSDLLGAVCLVFWLVLGFGIFFRGWFALRQPKAILWVATFISWTQEMELQKFEKKNSVGTSERIQTEGAVKSESKKDERANEKKSNGSDKMKKKEW